MSAGFNYNSGLPSGRMPFWIKDDALVDDGLRSGDVVGVDVQAEPTDGDLALVEISLDDGSSERIVRRYFAAGDGVTLRAAGPGFDDLVTTADQMFAVGVARTRVRYEQVGADETRIVEEPLGRARLE